MNIKNTFVIVFSICVFVFATDKVDWSQTPPGGISVSDAPQFVVIGWDDNARAGYEDTVKNGDYAINWIMKFLADKKNPEGSGNKATFDGTPVRCSFFVNTTYMTSGAVEAPSNQKYAYNNLFVLGHEVGNHTHSHGHGESYSEAQWENEISTANNWLEKPLTTDKNPDWWQPNENEGSGIPASEIVGFRTPFLEYNNELFTTLIKLNFMYDCSIEEGYQDDEDGTNFCWPYTLDNGSPGHAVLVEWGNKSFDITSHPGFWEIPNHCYIVPPDNECANYGIPVGLRDKMHAIHDWFSVSDGKVTGFDYNLWSDYSLNSNEALAVLKYTLDLRLKGNRAPLMMGAHTQYYSPQENGEFKDASTDYKEAQQTWEKFIDYALSKSEVRIVRAKDLVEWMRNPVALGSSSNKKVANATGFSIESFRGNMLKINTPFASRASVSVYSISGRFLWGAKNILLSRGENIVPLLGIGYGRAIIVSVKTVRKSWSRKIISLK